MNPNRPCALGPRRVSVTFSCRKRLETIHPVTKPEGRSATSGSEGHGHGRREIAFGQTIRQPLFVGDPGQRQQFFKIKPQPGEGYSCFATRSKPFRRGRRTILAFSPTGRTHVFVTGPDNIEFSGPGVFSASIRRGRDQHPFFEDWAGRRGLAFRPQRGNLLRQPHRTPDARRCRCESPPADGKSPNKCSAAGGPRGGIALLPGNPRHPPFRP